MPIKRGAWYTTQEKPKRPNGKSSITKRESNKAQIIKFNIFKKKLLLKPYIWSSNNTTTRDAQSAFTRDPCHLVGCSACPVVAHVFPPGSSPRTFRGSRPISACHLGATVFPAGAWRLGRTPTVGFPAPIERIDTDEGSRGVGKMVDTVSLSRSLDYYYWFLDEQ